MNSHFEAMILDLAGDDYTGLWELVWSAKASDAELTKEQVLPRLRDEVVDLIRQSKLALYCGTRFGGEEEKVPTEEALEMVKELPRWEPAGPDESHLRILATDES